MAKTIHKGKRKAVEAAAHKAAGRSASVIGRRTMCKAVEELVERRVAEGIAEGERKGKRETMLATAKRMLESGILALKDIAKFSGLSLAQVKKLQASMA